MISQKFALQSYFSAHHLIAAHILQTSYCLALHLHKSNPQGSTCRLLLYSLLVSIYFPKCPPSQIPNPQQPKFPSHLPQLNRMTTFCFGKMFTGYSDHWAHLVSLHSVKNCHVYFPGLKTLPCIFCSFIQVLLVGRVFIVNSNYYVMSGNRCPSFFFTQSVFIAKSNATFFNIFE